MNKYCQVEIFMFYFLLHFTLFSLRYALCSSSARLLSPIPVPLSHSLMFHFNPSECISEWSRMTITITNRKTIIRMSIIKLSSSGSISIHWNHKDKHFFLGFIQFQAQKYKTYKFQASGRIKACILPLVQIPSLMMSLTLNA